MAKIKIQRQHLRSHNIRTVSLTAMKIYYVGTTIYSRYVHSVRRFHCLILINTWEWRGLVAPRIWLHQPNFGIGNGVTWDAKTCSSYNCEQHFLRNKGPRLQFRTLWKTHTAYMFFTAHRCLGYYYFIVQYKQGVLPSLRQHCGEVSGLNLGPGGREAGTITTIDHPAPYTSIYLSLAAGRELGEVQLTFSVSPIW